MKVMNLRPGILLYTKENVAVPMIFFILSKVTRTNFRSDIHALVVLDDGSSVVKTYRDLGPTTNWFPDENYHVIFPHDK